jgi:hypothetical protein
LQYDDGTTGKAKDPPLLKTTDGRLQTSGSNLTPDVLDKSFRCDAAPPRLNADSCMSMLLIPFDRHPSAYVLLYNGDHGIQPVRTKRLQCGKHSSTKENLGEATLVFVRLVDCLLQYRRAEGLEVKRSYQWGPV